jgi:hypothetical protein
VVYNFSSDLYIWCIIFGFTWWWLTVAETFCENKDTCNIYTWENSCGRSNVIVVFHRIYLDITFTIMFPTSIEMSVEEIYKYVILARKCSPYMIYDYCAQFTPFFVEAIFFLSFNVTILLCSCCTAEILVLSTLKFVRGGGRDECLPPCCLASGLLYTHCSGNNNTWNPRTRKFRVYMFNAEQCTHPVPFPSNTTIRIVNDAKRTYLPSRKLYRHYTPPPPTTSTQQITSGHCDDSQLSYAYIVQRGAGERERERERVEGGSERQYNSGEGGS